LILRAQRSKRGFIRSGKRNSGVVRAAPRARSARDSLQLAVGIDVLDAVAEVTLEISGVRGDDKVSSIHLGFSRPGQVAVHVRGHHEARVLVHTGTIDESLPSLFTGLIAVDSRYGRVVGWGVRDRGRNGFVAQQSEAVIVRDKAAGFFHAFDGDNFASWFEGLGIDVADMNS
jgi:hypothetical protein